jgi:hypothetical protein
MDTNRLTRRTLFARFLGALAAVPLVRNSEYFCNWKLAEERKRQALQQLAVSQEYIDRFWERVRDKHKKAISDEMDRLFHEESDAANQRKARNDAFWRGERDD